MNDLQKISDDLVKNLSLQYEPVGVMLYSDTDTLPTDIPFTDRELKSYCQVVIFTANSEQVMWLLYALNYEKGGRMDLPQSGGALGGCADITALPMLKGVSNITFLGLGCRLKSAIEPCDLMLGAPGNEIEKIHAHILDMAKPIAMLNIASSAT